MKTITKLIWKEEGNNIGPLFKKSAGRTLNYQDGPTKCAAGGYYAKWFTQSKAEQIAKQLGVKLEIN